MDQKNLILVEEHLCTSGHDFNWDAKFTIIKKIEKDINIKSIIMIKKKEKEKKKRRQIDKMSNNICTIWISYENESPDLEIKIWQPKTPIQTNKPDQKSLLICKTASWK